MSFAGGEFLGENSQPLYSCELESLLNANPYTEAPVLSSDLENPGS